MRRVPLIQIISKSGAINLSQKICIKVKQFSAHNGIPGNWILILLVGSRVHTSGNLLKRQKSQNYFDEYHMLGLLSEIRH